MQDPKSAVPPVRKIYIEQNPPATQEIIKVKLTPAEVRERLEDPKIISAIVRGEPLQRIARAAGVSVASVYNFMRRLPMDQLLEAESRRVMHHLSRRKLGEEKYLALSTSAMQMIEKVRLLRDESTEIIEARAAGTPARLERYFRERLKQVGASSTEDESIGVAVTQGERKVFFEDDC